VESQFLVTVLIAFGSASPLSPIEHNQSIPVCMTRFIRTIQCRSRELHSLPLNSRCGSMRRCLLIGAGPCTGSAAAFPKNCRQSRRLMTIASEGLPIHSLNQLLCPELFYEFIDICEGSVPWAIRIRMPAACDLLLGTAIRKTAPNDRTNWN